VFNSELGARYNCSDTDRFNLLAESTACDDLSCSQNIRLLQFLHQCCTCQNGSKVALLCYSAVLCEAGSRGNTVEVHGRGVTGIECTRAIATCNSSCCAVSMYIWQPFAASLASTFKRGAAARIWCACVCVSCCFSFLNRLWLLSMLRSQHGDECATAF
jgi:hypothetical protein